MDLTHKPRIINAKYLKDVLGGEARFTITGEEKVKTRDDTVIECLILTDEKGESIFYNPNATARKQFTEAGITTGDKALNHILVFHVKKTMMGSEEVDAVRIKEILPPKAKQSRFSK